MPRKRQSVRNQDGHLALTRGAKDLRMEESLTLLRKGTATLGRAAELADVTHQEMAMFARSHGVEPSVSEDSIREELAGRRA